MNGPASALAEQSFNDGARNYSCGSVTIARVSQSVGATYELLEQFMVRLHCLGEAQAMDALVETDLSFSQVRAIFALTTRGTPIPINELAHELGMSMATTGRVVDQLVNDGLIVRREDPHDRRVRRISLSEAGRTLTEKHLDARRGALRSFVEHLPPDDRQRLSDALGPILAGNFLQPRPLEVVS